MANGRRHGNRDTQFGPEHLRVRAIDLGPSAGGLHQGAQPTCCRSDAVYMAATDQMLDPDKALAPREPSKLGPRTIVDGSRTMVERMAERGPSLLPGAGHWPLHIRLPPLLASHGTEQTVVRHWSRRMASAPVRREPGRQPRRHIARHPRRPPKRRHQGPPAVPPTRLAVYHSRLKDCAASSLGCFSGVQLTT